MRELGGLRPVFSVVTAALLLCLGGIAAAAGSVPTREGTNPDFLAWNLNRRMLGDGALAGGRRPSPLNLSHLDGVNTFPTRSRGASVSAASFDLRTQNKLSAVRDQGSLGLCWAFGALGSLESTLRPGVSTDLSEIQLAYQTFGVPGGLTAYTNWYDNGGDDWGAVSALTRWASPVYESEAPYPSGLPVAIPGGTVRFHVQDVVYLPTPFDYDWLDVSDVSHTTAILNLKTALVTYGGVSAGMCSDFVSPYWNAGTNAFYYSGSDGQDHGVVIVGWNDDYSRTNFVSTNRPPGDGAWIVRNSWGADWGDGGYFYASYYDKKLSGAIAYTAESADNYGAVYQYDPLGWVENLGYSSNTAWFANRFTAAANQTLRACSFYTSAPNSTYTISVYAGSGATNPTEGTRILGPVTGTVETPGYHTVKFSSGAGVSSGQTFAVVVGLTTPGYTKPIPVESALAGYSDNAAASAGQSFVSPDGTTWTDLTTLVGQSKSNVCLKAFADASAVTPTPSPLVTVTMTPTTNPTGSVTGTVTPTSSGSSGGGGGCGASGLLPAGLILLLPGTFVLFGRRR
jgi:C1A family cysteine protease